MIQVACGFVFNSEQKILIAQKASNHKLYANLWEFPGGKFEAGEGALAALERELKEELDLVVSAKKELGFIDKEIDSTMTLRLIAVLATANEDTEIKLKEHQAIAWLNKDEVLKWNLIESDQRLFNSLEKYLP